MGFRDRGIEIKTPEQIDLMRVAGLLVGETLELLRAAVRPGVSTLELDTLAEANIRDHGGVPSFKGYSHPPFPATICASVNDEVVHGIPGSRTLVDGDVISIDCGAIVAGWHGDAAVTVPVGEVADDVRELLRVTEESLWRGLAAVRPGSRLGDVSAAVEGHVRSQGRFGVVEEYTGHGIGTAMHQPPDVPNVGRRGRGLRLTPGLVIAVEPMVTAGAPDNHVKDDDWTVATDDGSLAAHFEHTVAVTERGPWVLTALDGGRDRLGDGWGGPAPASDAV
jgi:methionyl aminopeptidase